MRDIALRVILGADSLSGDGRTGGKDTTIAGIL